LSGVFFFPWIWQLRTSSSSHAGKKCSFVSVDNGCEDDKGVSHDRLPNYVKYVTRRSQVQVQPVTGELCARKLILKYITGQAGALRAQQSAGKPLAVIALRPERFVTTGYFPAT
jgi:hypothetical protein